MVKHWEESGPPVYMSVAGYLGLIKDGKKSYGDLEELEREFAGAGGIIGA